MPAFAAMASIGTRTAHALFARPEFAAQPARACHGLIRRLPKGMGEAAIWANAAKSAGQGVLPMGFRVWDEQLAVSAESPAAQSRRARESQRAVSGQPGLRAVRLQYQGGVSDLILVANRTQAGCQDLGLIAALLCGEDVPLPPGRPAPPSEPLTATVGPPPPWGLGDIRQSGSADAVELGVFAATQPILTTALATAGLLLSRYGDIREPRFPALIAHQAAPDELLAVEMNIDEQTTLGELLAAAGLCRLQDAAGFDSSLPPAGVVVAGCRAGDRYLPCLAPLFPVTLSWVQDEDGKVRGRLLYDRGAVDPAIAQRLARHVGLLTERILGSELDTRADDVVLIDSDEGAAILAAGSTPAPAGAVRTGIHTRFEELTRTQPTAPALSDASRTLTYQELDDQASAAASGLRALGVQPGDLVGVCLERDASLVITELGVLKAGAAYVPMDPVYPAERLAYTAKDAGIKIVVSTDGTFPADGGVAAVSVAGLLAAADPSSASAQTSPCDLAYVIYTSGSTGRPKGVAVPHRNVGALLAATVEDLRLGPEDVWTLFHSSAFDFSVWEIWGCLLSGGHLIVVPYWASRTPEEFRLLLAQRGVTVLCQTPSAFAELQEADSQHAALLALRLVIFGGEPLDVHSLKPWFRRYPPSRCRIVNMFGITETTVHVTSQTITPVEVEAGSRSVGRALPGWSVSVRDQEGRLQPFGVPGEIYVGGAGIASHYLNQEKLTAERFVHDPVTGKRVYRSGDLGLLRPDGSLDHLGRIDSQVKIRGFRIEPDEIRSVLLEDAGVSAAAVVLNSDGDGDAAKTRLDAYVVLRPGCSLAGVRQRASRYLPQHMMPATLRAVPELPLTVNGKVDADRLSALAAAEPTSAVDGAGLGGVVLKVWRDVLGQHIHADDDFFEAGGNSLLAVRLSGALRRAGLPALSLRDLYVHSTPAELSVFLGSAPVPPAGG